MKIFNIEKTLGAMIFKGGITVNSDFPASADVENGWTYRILADVTDDDASKTNTGQSFLLGEDIAWNGVNWTMLGPNALWEEDGTDMTMKTALNLKIGNTYWLRATDNAGTGVTNMMKVGADDEIEVGATLNAGTSEIEEDSGAVVLVDFPVSSTPTAGTEQSYSLRVDGSAILKVYAEADGAGGVQNEKVQFPKEAQFDGLANANKQEVIGKGADYTITLDDIEQGRCIVADTTSADVTFTLPQLSTLTDDSLLRTFAIGHNAGSNDLLLNTHSGDTFVYGNTFFNFNANKLHLTLAGIKSGISERWGLQRNTTVRGSFHRDASWASSNFSSVTTIPLDNEEYNNQNELLHYQEASAGTITAFADGGSGQVTVTDATHGLSENDRVTISGTTNYNGTFKVTNVTTNTFEITDTWVATDTGSWVSYTRVWIGTDGQYSIGYMIDIDSTGGSTWNATSWLYKNGIVLANTEVRTGNYGSEDQSMAFIPTYISLSEGDYIDLRIDQNNLTGNLVHAVLNIEIRL